MTRIAHRLMNTDAPPMRRDQDSVFPESCTKSTCAHCGTKSHDGFVWFKRHGERAAVHVRDIVALHAVDKVVEAHLANGRIEISSASVTQWMVTFPGEWVRVRANAAVRWSAVVRLGETRSFEGSELFIQVHLPHKTFTVSRDNRRAILRLTRVAHMAGIQPAVKV